MKTPSQLIMIFNEYLTNNDNCSASTSFQIERHKGNNSTPQIIGEVFVQTNVTLNKNISEYFDF